MVSTDTLGQQSSSSSYNTQNIKLLAAANNINPVVVEQVQTPNVVDKEALVPVSELAIDSESVSVTDEISSYVVKDGDTLSQIAKMFNVSVNTIRWANNMDAKTAPKVGQTLVILPISGIEYTIKKGDTLKGIANKFNGDESEITSYNNLSSNLVVGQAIIIPNGEINTVVKVASKNTKNNSSTKDNSSGKNVSSGYFVRPVKGGVRTQGVHGHNGVDLASSYGATISAAAGGKVIIAKDGGWNGGYGSYVVISHSNGTQTLYGHLSAVNVSVGDTVSQGQAIGAMGSTGQSTGVHLHFEVRGGKNPF